MAILLGACVALGIGGLMTGTAAAHWAGFTGDEKVGASVANRGFVATPSRHSYSFASAKNLSDGRGAVCASVISAVNGSTMFRGCSVSSNFVRTCLDGTYPNCHDLDGFSAWALAENFTGGRRVMQVHGVY